MPNDIQVGVGGWLGGWVGTPGGRPQSAGNYRSVITRKFAKCNSRSTPHRNNEKAKY